tara:strand:+ start:7573 stop:8970 length:1398 start_codon:yes stop_codon:yes gene_type:complete
MAINRTAASDQQTRVQARNESINEIIIDSEYGQQLPESFRAIVLSGFYNGGSDIKELNVLSTKGEVISYYFARVRPLNVAEFVIPSPFLEMRTCDAKNLILSHPLGFKKASSETALQPGGIYQCRFINHQQRTGIEILDLVELSDKRPIESGSGSGAKNVMKNGGSGTNSSTSSNDTPAPTSTPGALKMESREPLTNKKKSDQIYTRSAYDLLATDEYLKPVLDAIAKGEGNYNAYNCGTSGQGPFIDCDDDVRTNWGKPRSFADGKNKISEATVGTLRGMIDIRATRPSAGFLTVGRYQIAQSYDPKYSQALYKLLDNIDPPVKDDEVFNEKLQDMLGAALCMSYKRPALHGYLLGLNNDIDEATLDLAKEWASVGDPRPDTRNQTFYGSTANRATTEVETIQPLLKTARNKILSVMAECKMYDENGREFSTTINPDVYTLISLYDKNKTKFDPILSSGSDSSP